MFSPKGNLTQQNVDGQRHCILVAASNPQQYTRAVFRPQVQNAEQNDSVETQTDSHVSAAESVAKSFAQVLTKSFVPFSLPFIFLHVWY